MKETGCLRVQTSGAPVRTELDQWMLTARAESESKGTVIELVRVQTDHPLVELAGPSEVGDGQANRAVGRGGMDRCALERGWAETDTSCDLGLEDGRCWARTSDLRLVETALSQLS